MASEHTDSDAFRQAIEPETDFTIVSYRNLADQYDKDASVEQVPIILNVKGPLSLRRGGTMANGTTFSQEPYQVLVGDKQVV